MPRGKTAAYEDEEDYEDKRKSSSRKGKSRAPPSDDDEKYGAGSRRQGNRSDDDGDSDYDRRNKQVAKVPKKKSKPRSESGDSDSEDSSAKKKKKKSRSKKKKSKADDDDEEMITHQTARFKTVEYGDLDFDYAMNLERIFEVQPKKVSTWCDNELIRFNNGTHMLDASKLIEKLKKGGADKQELKDWATFEKKYKRTVEEHLEESRGYAPSHTTIVMAVPSRSYRSRCQFGTAGCDGYSCGYCRHEMRHGHLY